MSWFNHRPKAPKTPEWAVKSTTDSPPQKPPKQSSPKPVKKKVNK